MSQEDTNSNSEPAAEEGSTPELPPMNRAERRALANGKKSPGNPPRGSGLRGGSNVTARGNVVTPVANQTRSSNRGK